VVSACASAAGEDAGFGVLVYCVPPCATTAGAGAVWIGGSVVTCVDGTVLL
jgi:hypothetical protein